MPHLAPSHCLALNKHGTLVNKTCFGETKVEINRSSTLVALFTPAVPSTNPSGNAAALLFKGSAALIDANPSQPGFL